MQRQKKKTEKETVVVRVPKSFEWVIVDMLKLKNEKYTGEVIYNYKNGGICNKKEPKGYDIIYPPK